jgi:hypothetical protein
MGSGLVASIINGMVKDEDKEWLCISGAWFR